jgi:hypothetical protein
MATGDAKLHEKENLYAETLVLGAQGSQVTLSGTEFSQLDGITAGTVTASKAVVVDASKDAAAFRNVTVTNLDAGASGTAGTVDVFPTTASKGKLAISVTDQTGDTTVGLVAGEMGQATVVTIPDPGASTANVVLSAGAATIAGAKTFTTMPIIPAATVAATGTVQADAAAITTGFTLVTGADDAKGVKLPAAAAGLVCIIKVGDGADLKVWPNTGDAINAIAANNAMTVVDDVCFMLVALDATTWYTVPLLPS